MATQAVETPAPRRGRPPKVSQEAILDAVDAKHHGDWTMASIAAELSVSEPAIYYHFPSKQALLVALGRRVIEQLPLPRPTDDWEVWLNELANEALGLYRQHPFLADINMTTIAVQQTASVRVLEELLGHLRAFGFSTDDAVMALSGVLLVVQQFATALGAADPLALSDQLAAIAKASGAPLAEGVYTNAAYSDVDETFRRMLRVVLAGIRVELAPRGRRRKAQR